MIIALLRRPGSLWRCITFAGLAAAVAAGCSSPAEVADGEFEDDLINTEGNGQPSQRWIYAGMLPAFEDATVVASLKGHTVRVTGYLPDDFDGPLPFYVAVAAEAGRRRATVVYPIATGAIDPTTGQAPAGPGTYDGLSSIAYTPTTSTVTWGGFPFMKYNRGRGLAFHGPITSAKDASSDELEWRLRRGPVSHGCNRMQGEHVVELAHVLGLDMAKPHPASRYVELSPTVRIVSAYDTFEGKKIDVDYPALPSVARASGPTAKTYPTWDSRDFPRFVCAYDKARPLGPAHCDAAGENTRDALTGKPLDVPASPWVGSACDGDAACAFGAGAKAGKCLTVPGEEGEARFCSLSCTGYCPDKLGAAGTFCVDVGGAGQCVSKAGAENDGCAAIAGTEPVVAARFVGTSGAPAASATVCLPR